MSEKVSLETALKRTTRSSSNTKSHYDRKSFGESSRRQKNALSHFEARENEDLKEASITVLDVAEKIASHRQREFAIHKKRLEIDSNSVSTIARNFTTNPMTADQQHRQRQLLIDECQPTNDIFRQSYGPSESQHNFNNNLSIQEKNYHHYQNDLHSAYDCNGSHYINSSTAHNQSSSSSSSTFNISLIDHPEEVNFSEIETVWLVKGWQEVLLRVAFVAPIVLLGIIGNLTIIYSMGKFKRFRTKPTNIFILNMAFADLLTTIVCPNAALFMDIYQFYVMGAFVCRFEGFIKITCLLVSAYSLIVLSFDWFLCVVQPCRKRISIEQSWFTLASIWVVSVVMASPLFVWRRLRERQWKDLLEVWCCEQIQYTKYYWLCMTFFLIYLPTFIMTIVLVIILLQMDRFEAKLKRSRQFVPRTGVQAAKHQRAARFSMEISSWNSYNQGGRVAESKFNTNNQQVNNRAIMQPTTSTASVTLQVLQSGISTNDHDDSSPATTATATATATTTTNNKMTNKQQDLNGSLSMSMKYRRRIMKILFAYLSCSVICWTPLQFSIIYRHFRTEPVPASWFFELTFYASLCASLSGAMNPIIFGFLSQPFRQIVTKSWIFRLFDKLLTQSQQTNSNAKHNNNPNNNLNHLANQGSHQPKANERHKQRLRQFSIDQRNRHLQQQQPQQQTDQKREAAPQIQTKEQALRRDVENLTNSRDNDNNSALRLSLDFLEPNQHMHQSTTPTDLGYQGVNSCLPSTSRQVSNVSQFVYQGSDHRQEVVGHDNNHLVIKGRQADKAHHEKSNNAHLYSGAASRKQEQVADRNNNNHKQVSFNNNAIEVSARNGNHSIGRDGFMLGKENQAYASNECTNE